MATTKKTASIDSVIATQVLTTPIPGLIYPKSDSSHVVSPSLKKLFEALTSLAQDGHPSNCILTGPQGCG